MLSPTLGRWTQEDPIGFDGGDVNLYRTESDSPEDDLDPSGLDENSDKFDGGMTVIEVTAIDKPRIYAYDMTGKVPERLGGNLLGAGAKPVEITEAQKANFQLSLIYGGVSAKIAAVLDCGQDPKDYFFTQTRKITANGKAGDTKPDPEPNGLVPGALIARDKDGIAMADEPTAGVKISLNKNLMDQIIQKTKDGKLFLRPIVLNDATIKGLLKQSKGTETQEFVTTLKKKVGGKDTIVGSWSWGFTAEIDAAGNSSTKVLPLKWALGK
jgi:hypothetical protein